MQLAKGLTPHTILLLFDKPEKAVPLVTLFQKIRYKVITAVSLYESLRLVDQEMPHLIVCDALLADGTAGNLYDRMQQNELFRSIPILVMIATKTKEQLSPLKGRKFSGFVLGKVDPRALVLKVKEILEGHADISPFFIKADDEGLSASCTLAANAKAIGRIGDQLICVSDLLIDSETILLCIPPEKGRGSALLKLASNVQRESSVYNVFPINQIRGSGRLWIAGLPEIKLSDISRPKDGHRIVFYDHNFRRFEQFKQVLSGYGFELLYARDLQMAMAMAKREIDNGLACIYLDELPSNNSGISIREFISKIPEKVRPSIIAATTALSSRSSAEVRYIKKPFALSVLIEALDGAVKARSKMLEAGASSLEIQYQAPAKLLGLDETGGILQTKFPLAEGNRFQLQHATLLPIWDGKGEVRITSVVRLADEPQTWQLKFEASIAQGSKSRYWEKLSRQITRKPA